jgi:hypothetical protein
MSKNTKKILAVVLLLVVIAAAVLAYLHFKPQASEGAKTVTIEVVHKDESKKEFVLHTDAETLHAALDEEKLIEGEDRGGFFMVIVVDGETADYDVDCSYWAMMQDGEWMMTGVDDTMIKDGDHYEFVYTPAA